MNATLTIMATGYTCIRRFLCLFNLLIWVSIPHPHPHHYPSSSNTTSSPLQTQLSGSCLVGIGLWLTLSYDTYARILPSYHLLSADNLALAIGALTFFTAFCGCCGAWFQSKTLLTVYLATVILIMVVEILLGAVCFAFQTQLGATLQSELLDGIHHRYQAAAMEGNGSSSSSSGGEQGFRSTWDHLQTHFRCCGVNNYTDWYHIAAWPDKQRVPDSCCRPLPLAENSTEVCGLQSPTINSTLLWRHGCLAKVRHYLLANIHGVGITSILFAFLQFVALVCAFLLLYTVDYKKDRRKRKALSISASSSRSTYNRIRTM